MENVFRALGHPGRRLLLDRLFERDGQSLGELVAHLELSRFGVMKHLRTLEAAGLVITRKSGRQKLHYLNPVPIRLVHDRWVSKYARPWVGAMGDLKAELEDSAMGSAKRSDAVEERAMSSVKHVYEVYIRTTPEKLWEAITSPGFTSKYFYDTSVESDWKVGSRVVHRQADGRPALEGEVLEIEPPKRLVTTFRAVHDPEAAGDRSSRVTWEIQPMGSVCKLTLTHDDFDGETRTYRMVGSGWNPVLSGLKTLLETGRPLEISR